MALSSGTINLQEGTPTGVIINFNVTYGEDPQPLYEAGSSTIKAVLKMESMAQIQVSKAMFDGTDRIDGRNGITLLGVPSMTIKDPAIKYSYSASSGQVYVVENLVIVGKKL